MLFGLARSTSICLETSAFGVFRSRLVTSAPASNSCSATACPMPEAAPVTT
ncbi:Uncharacterised protein [Mycobacteroides abscessus subsp. abscessus]|nr:Uncharacterised protein [Mycobacteroides abscessus subsp. abscessus]